MQGVYSAARAPQPRSWALCPSLYSGMEGGTDKAQLWLRDRGGGRRRQSSSCVESVPEQRAVLGRGQLLPQSGGWATEGVAGT